MVYFHDWERVLSTPGFRKHLLAYGRVKGQIKPRGRLPRVDLEYMASDAIESGPQEFTIQDRLGDMGSFHVRRFAGYYWVCSFENIDGPYADLMEAIGLIRNITRGTVGFYVMAEGNLDHELIADLCVELVEPGKNFKINGKSYVRTHAGLELST